MCLIISWDQCSTYLKDATSYLVSPCLQQRRCFIMCTDQYLLTSIYQTTISHCCLCCFSHHSWSMRRPRSSSCIQIRYSRIKRYCLEWLAMKPSLIKTNLSSTVWWIQFHTSKLWAGLYWSYIIPHFSSLDLWSSATG